MRLLTAWIFALQIAAFPRPDGYVNDFASILDEPAETYLESYLSTLERDTSAEVVVATVTSLDGMSIEEYANRLFAGWGIGKRHKDNGVLLLVAPNEREVRIEVGYGLEGTIPDGLAGDIVRVQIIPQFKANNFPKGIGSGLDRIARIVRQDPSASIRSDSSDERDSSPPLWLIVAFLGSFIVIGAFATGLGFRTKTYGPLIFGCLFAGTPWVFLALFPSFVPFAILAPLAIAGFVLGLRKGGSPFWRSQLRSHRLRSRDDGGWEMGSTSSGDGSSDSSGSSSSSSSFGGGSSGGGGASGRW
jgi:uncharacterized protein